MKRAGFSSGEEDLVDLGIHPLCENYLLVE